MKQHLRILVPIIAGLIFAGFAWNRLVNGSSDLLYAAQEHSLWLSESSFFHEMCLKPGGILSWCGRYLTQFFFYPELGSSILILFWLLLYGMLAWGLRLRWWLTPLALLPSVLLLLSVTAPTYQIYQIKAPDYWFTPTLTALLFALIFTVTRYVKSRWRIALQLCILASFLGTEYKWMNDTQLPQELRIPSLSRPDDANFLAELRIERAAIEGDWKQILSETKHAKQRITRQMLLYQNIALYNRDRLSEEWLYYPQMTMLPQMNDGHVTLAMTEIGGMRIYLLHGCLQFAYRWSMEEMVEYGPTIRNLRLMAECSLLSGEYDVVYKYTGILKRTLFHNEEAEALEQLAKHPEQIASHPRYKKAYILSHSQKDMLDSDENRCEKYLWNHYSTLVNGDIPELNLLCLHYALQTQDIERFWNQFFAYAHIHNEDDNMPRLYQEAAYLYSRLEPHRVDTSRMPFSDDVKNSYTRFMQTTQRLLQSGKSDAAVGVATQREFGHTFYWFYYFCRNLDTY